LRRSLLNGLWGRQTGREACPDSMSVANAYREAQVGQQKRSHFIHNRLKSRISGGFFCK